MNGHATTATALRVLSQLRRDPRTIALIVGVPCVLEALLEQIFSGRPPVFQHVGAPLLGLFPFVSMFVVTSVTMLRERTSGTLERLMTLPLGKLDLLAGYALAFALMATVPPRSRARSAASTTEPTGANVTAASSGTGGGSS